MNFWRSCPFLFGLTFLLLVLALVSSWLFYGPLAWAVGILYITYDSFLLAYMVINSRDAVLQPERPCRSKDLIPSGRALPEAPSLSVLIPSRNERKILPKCLAALEKQTDQPEEIIVIDDGSQDGTGAWLQETYQLETQTGLSLSRTISRLKVFSKPRSGKADSLNQAFLLATGEIIITLDADTLLEPSAIAEIRSAFAKDAQLAAVCGVLVPQCAPARLGRIFEFYQRFEYLRGFLWRLAWTRHEMLLLISGAFAAYRQPVLKSLGGYNPASLVEDYDLIYRLHRFSHDHQRGWKTRVIGTAQAVTDAPGAPALFLRQRARWFAGFLETLFRNHDMVGNTRFASVGLWMLPIKVIDSLLPIYALCSFFILLILVLTGKSLPALVWIILGVKAAYDLFFHFWALKLYFQWQRLPLTWASCLRTILATFTEPFGFQLLRHVGAFLGWIAFLRGRIEWTPQREYSQEPSS